ALQTWRPPTSTRFPYTTLFRSRLKQKAFQLLQLLKKLPIRMPACPDIGFCWQAGEVFWLGEQQTLRYTRANIRTVDVRFATITRSEEHTSELQSRENLVCRLLL